MRSLQEIYKDQEERFIEQGAALEHARWSRWFVWQKNNSTPENIERWQKQADTAYQNLSRPERESDQREVREYLPLHRATFIAALDGVCEMVKSKMFPLMDSETEAPRSHGYMEALTDLLTSLQKAREEITNAQLTFCEYERNPRRMC